MARTLDQILAELTPSYSGSENIIKQQQPALELAAQAEISGIDAKLTQANDSILGSARARGLGFAGIPVAEQAKYAATEYAPAIARVKSNQISQQSSLSEALNQLGRDKMSAAQGYYQQDLARDEQVRQFNEQMNFQREQAAAAERASRAAASAGAGSYLGGGGYTAAVRTSGPTPAEQAYLNVQGFLSKGKSAAESDYAATLKSANKGNALDKLKIEAYHRAGIKPGGNNSTLALSFPGVSFGGTSYNGLNKNILSGVRF